MDLPHACRLLIRKNAPPSRRRASRRLRHGAGRFRQRSPGPPGAYRRNLGQAGLAAGEALVFAYRAYQAATLPPYRISLDRAFNLVSYIDGIWLANAPALSVLTCPGCGCEFIAAVGTVAHPGEPCPFCKLLERFHLDHAKIEWHPGELFPRVGFIVTNLPMEPDWVVRFYNQRGTAEQHIKEGKYAFRWTRLSCRKFRDNEVRLQLHALAYNLATFLRCIELPEAMADWSLTSLQLKLIKIGARVVRHARTITFQLAEVAVTGTMVRAILAAIRRLRAPPLCA
jgi:hypothetical protein